MRASSLLGPLVTRFARRSRYPSAADLNGELSRKLNYPLACLLILLKFDWMAFKTVTFSLSVSLGDAISGISWNPLVNNGFFLRDIKRIMWLVVSCLIAISVEKVFHTYVPGDQGLKGLQLRF